MKNSLKSKLKSGKSVLGGWVMIGHPGIAEIMGRSGLDWVGIDLEHAATDLMTAENLIRAAGMAGAAPLVRLTSNDADQIKRVMDSGAHGIIVPQVTTAAQAQSAVAAMYYPPRGNRGTGLARAQGYGAAFKDYKDWLESDAVCIVQIEDVNAVKNLREILSVKGVDGYMLGPYDLSASLGRPGDLDHPDVLAAIEEVRVIAKDMKKPGGIHIVEPDLEKLRKALKDGFTFIVYSIDTRIIDAASRAAVAALSGKA